ncbi:hypothetical protein ACMAZE_08140 [Pseudopelagicola sp. nBUS_20]|uniref:hypothetical protein n=1 Tax=Pseudopelagicola sp. nBUS_20 TaxID=3395317 RepID=UPI003EBF0DFB
MTTLNVTIFQYRLFVLKIPTAKTRRNIVKSGLMGIAIWLNIFWSNHREAVIATIVSVAFDPLTKTI